MAIFCLLGGILLVLTDSLISLVIEMDAKRRDLSEHFVREINNNKEFVGDVLEFGTGSGNSTLRMIRTLREGKIYTFDGFVGLPKTNKIVPKGSNWVEGAFKFDEQTTRNKLKPYNVIVEKCMTWELKEPKEYGINKISGVSIDLDLYEGTLDALNFMDKCEWDNVLLRFDDWGYYRNTEQVKEEVEEHEFAAFYDFINEKGYEYKIYDELVKLSDNRHIIIKVSR